MSDLPIQRGYDGKVVSAIGLVELVSQALIHQSFQSTLGIAPILAQDGAQLRQ